MIPTVQYILLLIRILINWVKDSFGFLLIRDPHHSNLYYKKHIEIWGKSYEFLISWMRFAHHYQSTFTIISFSKSDEGCARHYIGKLYLQLHSSLPVHLRSYANWKSLLSKHSCDCLVSVPGNRQPQNTLLLTSISPTLCSPEKRHLGQAWKNKVPSP